MAVIAGRGLSGTARDAGAVFTGAVVVCGVGAEGCGGGVVTVVVCDAGVPCDAATGAGVAGTRTVSTRTTVTGGGVGALRVVVCSRDSRVAPATCLVDALDCGEV